MGWSYDDHNDDLNDDLNDDHNDLCRWNYMKTGKSGRGKALKQFIIIKAIWIYQNLCSKSNKTEVVNNASSNHIFIILFFFFIISFFIYFYRQASDERIIVLLELSSFSFLSPPGSFPLVAPSSPSLLPTARFFLLLAWKRIRALRKVADDSKN